MESSPDRFHLQSPDTICKRLHQIDAQSRSARIHNQKGSARPPEHEAGSLYINNSAVTLNFYDKFDEMQKAENGTRHTPEEIQEAKDILRIEVQAGRDKLSGTKRKQEFTTKQISEFMQRPEAAEQLVLMYAEKVLGSATYRKKPAAITLINHSKKQKKTKEQLIEVLNEVSQPYKRIDEVRAARPDLEIDKCKKILREMDINLVTPGQERQGERAAVNPGPFERSNRRREEHRRVRSLNNLALFYFYLIFLSNVVI